MAMSIGGSDVETVLLPARAAAGGGDITVPVGASTGFFTINPAAIAAPITDVRFIGSGWGCILRYAGAGGVNSTIVGTTSVTANNYALRITFENLVLDCNNLGERCVSTAGYNADWWSFRRVWFKNFTGFGFIGAQLRKAKFDQCLFSRPGDAVGVGIEIVEGIYDPDITNCQFEWLNLGILIDSGTSGEVPSYRVFCDSGNRVRQDYGLIKAYADANATGSGGTVTYNATHLFDTSKNFTAIPFDSQRTIRVMPVLRTSTTTNVGQTILVDGAADFTKMGIQYGYLVRTASAWAMVTGYNPLNGTQLFIDGWKDLTTYEPVVPVPTGTAYTLYAIIYGETNSVGVTAVQTLRWRDPLGNTVTSIAAGTRYEILGNRSTGGIHFENGVAQSIIGRTFANGGWSDNVTSGGPLCTISDVITVWSQDTGLTVQGAGTTIFGGIYAFNGAQGIAIDSTSDVMAVGPSCQDNGTEYDEAPVSGDVSLFAAVRCTVAYLLSRKVSAPNDLYGILMRDACSDNRLYSNLLYNHTTAPIYRELSVLGTRFYNNDPGT